MYRDESPFRSIIHPRCFLKKVSQNENKPKKFVIKSTESVCSYRRCHPMPDGPIFFHKSEMVEGEFFWASFKIYCKKAFKIIRHETKSWIIQRKDQEGTMCVVYIEHGHDRTKTSVLGKGKWNMIPLSHLKDWTLENKRILSYKSSIHVFVKTNGATIVQFVKDWLHPT